MADFNNPLSDDFLNDVYKGKRETWGDDLIRPRQFIIGRLNTDGTFSTVVTSGEYGRVWVREPGDDAGDAVQAVNTTLQQHEITFNRPVMVKKERGELLIVGKAIQSANYEAQSVNRMQTQTNREQYLVALIYPRAGNDFVVNYKGGMYQINNAKYRVPDKVSGDLAGTVPGANALSIKVEIDPLTGTYHETTGTAFTFSTMINAFDNGDLDTTVTLGRFLLGWIRLYDGQSEITNDDILPGEYMLLTSHDDGQYVATAPGSDTRNDVKATGDFTGQSWIARAGQTKPLTQWIDANGTPQLQVMPDGDILTDPSNLTNTLFGDGVGRPSGDYNTYFGQISGGSGSGSSNTFFGWEAGTSSTSGESNTGIGFDALWLITTGNNNTAVGEAALGALSVGIQNVAVGVGAGGNLTGNNNTMLGFQAGLNLGNGTGNVYLGYQAGYNASGNYEFWVHYGNGTVPTIFADLSGETVGFGTTSPQGRVDITGRKDEVQAYVHSLANQTVDNSQFGNIKAGNYTAFEEDGTARFEGDATVWDDLRIPGLSTRTGAVAPDLIPFLAAGSLRVYGFNGVNLTEEVYFTVQLPHSYKEGTDIDPHIHWSPVNANAGNVKWQLEYTWANIDGTFPASTTISIVDAASGTAWDHQYAEFVAITGTSKSISSMLVCRLFRDPGDGADTYASDAAFLEFDFHFQIDTVGSREELTK